MSIRIFYRVREIFRFQRGLGYFKLPRAPVSSLYVVIGAGYSNPKGIAGIPGCIRILVAIRLFLASVVFRSVHARRQVRRTKSPALKFREIFGFS